LKRNVNDTRAEFFRELRRREGEDKRPSETLGLVRKERNPKVREQLIHERNGAGAGLRLPRPQGSGTVSGGKDIEKKSEPAGMSPYHVGSERTAP